MLKSLDLEGGDLALAPRLRAPLPGRRDDLLRQAKVAQALGSSFVAEVMTAAWRGLDVAPGLAATIDGWPTDPAADAMALRLNAGLHALARSGDCAILSALYAGGHRHFDAAIAEGMRRGEERLLDWMDHPTQTNEVRRSSAFMAVLTRLAGELAMPFELFEIGASAGLNLLLDRYGHDLGGLACGDASSPLQLSPRWRGPRLEAAPVTVVAARGVDLRPLRVDDPTTCERLQAYIWPGETDRADALSVAMEIAAPHLPVVDTASAAPWLARALGRDQDPGICRVVQHSMVLQYLPLLEKAGVIAAIAQAGRRASARRPLAWIGLEWDRPRTRVLLTLRLWRGREDDGRKQVLATCHPYGAAIDWFG